MNILILTGSPRPNGNSNFLAERFAEGAKAAGHTVTHLDTAHLDVHPCIACEHCHNGSGTCTFHDGFTDIRVSTPAATTSSSPRRPPSSSPWPTPTPTPPRPPSCSSARSPPTKAGPMAASSSHPASGPPATPRTPLTPTRPTPSASLSNEKKNGERKTENGTRGKRATDEAKGCGAKPHREVQASKPPSFQTSGREAASFSVLWAPTAPSRSPDF